MGIKGSSTSLPALPLALVTSSLTSPLAYIIKAGSNLDFNVLQASLASSLNLISLCDKLFLSTPFDLVTTSINHPCYLCIHRILMNYVHFWSCMCGVKMPCFWPLCQPRSELPSMVSIWCDVFTAFSITDLDVVDVKDPATHLALFISLPFPSSKRLGHTLAWICWAWDCDVWGHRNSCSSKEENAEAYDVWMAAFVVWMQRSGQLPPETPVVLSQVAFRVLIPCFLMTKVCTPFQRYLHYIFDINYVYLI